MSASQAFTTSLRLAGLTAVCLLLAIAGCGAGTSASSGSTTTTTSTNQYAAAYKAMTWGSGVTATFSGDCSMTLSASGTPPFHNAYYLAPAGSGQTVVAVTPSGMSMAVVPYTGGISNVNKISATFNICPTKATSTTSTQGGSIGVMSSGEVLFNPYEATGTVALGDNVSYTFTSGGTSYTASFIDQCNSHAAGGQAGGGSTWHYHGVPTCWTQSVDGATGASHIIGIALDGFPIYGGRDVSGNVITTSQLDACNGITSATPEFPSGAYHYVLPIGVTSNRSSLGCYTGTVNATVVAEARKLACHMKGMRMDGM
ncbi:MAG TPA: YHYH protein [Acidobacteriaceae bacterium]|jgi:hypothetical protein